MKKSRFSDSEILSVLKQADGGSPVAELCRVNMESVLRRFTNGVRSMVVWMFR